MFYTGERSINLFINVTFLFEMFEFLTTNPLKWLQKYILTHIFDLNRQISNGKKNLSYSIHGIFYEWKLAQASSHKVSNFIT